MALRAKSLFLFGLEVNLSNQNIPFKADGAGPELNAVIPTGFYSLTSFLTAIIAALQTADPDNTYTATADRSIASGTENRITIGTDGTHLDLLFNSGASAASSIRDLAGFAHTDRTGSTSYTGTSTAGTALQPDWWGKNYKDPQVNLKNFGAVNVSTDGTKEAITWSVQRFIEVEFENEPEAAVFAFWPALINWMIQQKPFDFTPEISFPNAVFPVTLEKSSQDGQGLAFLMNEQTPDKPFLYTTGTMTFRVIGQI